MVAPVDFTGKVAGYLTAERSLGSNGRKRMWECRCVCGKTCVLESSDFGSYLKNGNLASCGCKRNESIGRQNTRHGLSEHPAYAVWASMLARCYRETHHAYKNYGARGISVCAHWRDSFENFWADMGPTYLEGLSLDRVDNDGGYAPENCAWVTPLSQARNRRNSVGKVQTPAGPLYIEEVAEKFGIPKSTVRYRVTAGLSGEALVAPPKNGNHLTARGSAEEVRSIMAEPIAWAPGLPLNGSVGEMMRYAKD